MAGSTLIAVGELVILRDGQRGTVEQVKADSGEPVYALRLADGSQKNVEADGLVRAKTYAEWVATGSGWNGMERRGTERRAGERRKSKPDPADLERRAKERRNQERRRR